MAFRTLKQQQLGDFVAQFGKCSMCGKQIETGQQYVKCTVSTCNRKRTGLIFCGEACWDAHLPDANHRSAAYTEHVAR